MCFYQAITKGLQQIQREQQKSPAKLLQPGSSHAKQFNSSDLNHQLCHFFSFLPFSKSWLGLISWTLTLPLIPSLPFLVSGTSGNLTSCFIHHYYFWCGKPPVCSSCHAPNFLGLPQTAHYLLSCLLDRHITLSRHHIHLTFLNPPPFILGIMQFKACNV